MATQAKPNENVTKNWSTQVYDSEGNWVGFFMNDSVAKSWVGKQKAKGYEINNTPPKRLDREGLTDVSNPAPTIASE